MMRFWFQHPNVDSDPESEASTKAPPANDDDEGASTLSAEGSFATACPTIHVTMPPNISMKPILDKMMDLEQDLQKLDHEDDAVVQLRAKVETIRLEISSMCRHGVDLDEDAPPAAETPTNKHVRFESAAFSPGEIQWPEFPGPPPGAPRGNTSPAVVLPSTPKAGQEIYVDSDEEPSMVTSVRKTRRSSIVNVETQDGENKNFKYEGGKLKPAQKNPHRNRRASIGP